MPGGRSPAKASSTNPARRGENTASPSCTRSTACGQVVGRDRLGDVAAGAGSDHGDHVLGGVAHRQGQEHDVRAGRGAHRLDDRPPPAARQVHVEQHHVGRGAADALDGRLDVDRLADDVDGSRPAELGPHAGQEQPVVVDQEHAGSSAVAGRRHRATPASSGQLEGHLGALAGRAVHLGAAAVAGHAAARSTA